jgi:hypothetical protein
MQNHNPKPGYAQVKAALESSGFNVQRFSSGIISA